MTAFWIGTPTVEPIEALLTHAGRENGHAATTHDATDRHATTRIVASGRPDGPMRGRVELSGHDTRSQARICRQHLVSGDHRETIAEHHDDRIVDARDLFRQDDMIRNGDPVAGQIVVPVDTPQVAGIGTLVVGVPHERRIDSSRIGQLGEGR